MAIEVCMVWYSLLWNNTTNFYFIFYHGYIIVIVCQLQECVKTCKICWNLHWNCMLKGLTLVAKIFWNFLLNIIKHENMYSKNKKSFYLNIFMMPCFSNKYSFTIFNSLPSLFWGSWELINLFSFSQVVVISEFYFIFLLRLIIWIIHFLHLGPTSNKFMDTRCPPNILGNFSQMLYKTEERTNPLCNQHETPLSCER
jgi:hypothetical protein